MLASTPPALVSPRAFVIRFSVIRDVTIYITIIKTQIILLIIKTVVLDAIRSFPSGSAGGPDGVRPQILVDLVSPGDASDELLPALTRFVNLLLAGECHPEVTPYLFGGNLLALAKPSGGIRPIAVGYVWRRLAAKCANSYATKHTAPISCM